MDLLHPYFQIDYGALSGVNADFTAVLHVPALSITYPVVKSKDNEEYLHRTFEGKANFAGSIFLDANAKGSYDQYLSLIQRLSSYRNYLKDSIDFSQRPDIITLSTCSGPSGGNQRFIVQAALEEVYQNG